MLHERHYTNEQANDVLPVVRLTVRRLQMGSWCVGMTQRALDMLVEHANQRVTFGQKLADRQAIQWWVADAATKLHACRLMVMDAAVKQDEGRDVRMEASMIKVFATEMATEVIDHAQQAFGAMSGERWKSFYDSMAAVEVLPRGLDVGRAYTLEFVNKGIGKP